MEMSKAEYVRMLSELFENESFNKSIDNILEETKGRILDVIGGFLLDQYEKKGDE